MSYTYDFGSDVEDIAGALVVYLISFLFSGGLSIAMYVLRSLGTYTIAKRRELNHAWMAWVPVLDYWMLGSVSDQYQYVVKHQVKNKRKVLLGLNIAMAVTSFIVLTVVVGMFFSLLFSAMDISELFTTFSEETMEILVSNLIYYVGTNYGLLILLSILAILLSVLTIIQAVFFLMALYDVYRSCDPKNCTLYFVLSLFGNVAVEGAYSVFLILCKDKDLGMPPRKEDVVIPEEIAEEIPENTVE